MSSKAGDRDSAINECNQTEIDHSGFGAINRVDFFRNAGASIKPCPITHMTPVPPGLPGLCVPFEGASPPTSRCPHDQCRTILARSRGQAYIADRCPPGTFRRRRTKLNLAAGEHSAST